MYGLKFFFVVFDNCPHMTKLLSPYQVLCMDVVLLAIFDLSNPRRRVLLYDITCTGTVVL